jgi:hypothetical protein
VKKFYSILIDLFLFLVGLFLVWVNYPYLETSIYTDMSFICGVICVLLGAYLMYVEVKDYLK